MKRAVLILLLLVSTFSAECHEGGHGTSSEKVSRVWHLQDDTEITGTFLLTKENMVLIETDGEVLTVSIESLSVQGQKYVEAKVAEIQEINDHTTKYNDQEAMKSEAGMWQPLILLLFLIVFLWVVGTSKKRKGKSRRNRKLASGLACLMVFVIAISCSSDDGDMSEIEEEIGALISAISDPLNLDEAFGTYKDLVSTRWDDDYFYVESNGIPNHEMMVGITAWIAQVPVPHSYTGDDAWSIPLNTKYAASPISIDSDLRRGAIGVAANGIPIFNPVNASGLISNEIGELDAFGGHSGRGDDYHYHTAPIHLEGTSGVLPIAYAFDGYPVYGSKEPDGSSMTALDDTYHGHEGADGSFHYHGTSTYPYMVASLRGEVTLEGSSPETQITPQPVGKAFRGDPHPINSDDLIITALTENSTSNGYLLEYTSKSVNGSVEYNWDDSDLFTFIFKDIDGNTTTETFQR